MYIPTEERWKDLFTVAKGGTVPGDLTEEELEIVEELKRDFAANPGKSPEIPFD